jgi:hypothetical protein
LTRTMRTHTAKLGLYVEHWREVKGEQGNFAGTLDFSRDSNNPQDSNYAYGNAVLGVLKSYSESSSRLPIYGFTTGVEWYAQDNWKVSRKLTVDYGLRFGWSQPWHSNRNNEAGFLPWLWDPAQQVRLVQPVIVGGKRLALDPVTGDVLPAVSIGAIAAGSGNLYNGIVDREANPGYPQGLRNDGGLKAAPRASFAYDPFGKGKTVIRGGFGLFYETHERDNFTNNITYNPPLRTDPTIEYTTINDYINARGLTFPSNITGFDPNRKVARTMNFSFGIQHEIAKLKTLVDVAYVGSLARHLVQRTNLNTTPLGTNFLPQKQDPTSPESRSPLNLCGRTSGTATSIITTTAAIPITTRCRCRSTGVTRAASPMDWPGRGRRQWTMSTARTATSAAWSIPGFGTTAKPATITRIFSVPTSPGVCREPAIW